MTIFIAIISILIITALIWILNKFLPLKVCPICAGVFGTWLWMLIGVLLNQLPITNYQLPIAILMGGSVVGVAYQIEKRLPLNRSLILWKTLFIPTGFTAVYSVLASWWFIFVILVVSLIILTLIFVKQTRNAAISEERNRTVEKLKNEMENCC